MNVFVTFSPQQANDLDYAFTGHLIETELLDEIADNGLRLVFEVERVYRGNVTSPFTVYTHAQESACGAMFSENVQVGVIARQWNGQVSTSLCDQLLDLSKADLTGQFGAGILPLGGEVDEAPRELGLTWPVLAGLVALACVGSLAILSGIRGSRRSAEV